MPSGSSAARAGQKAALAAVIHAKQTSPDLRDAIAATRNQQNLGPYEAASLRDADRAYRDAKGVPPQLERDIAALQASSMKAWVAARSASDFAAFQPSLEEMLRLQREKALAMRPGEDPYDTLIDTYERGMTAARIEQIFDDISEPLKAILDRVLEAKASSGRQVHPALLGGPDWDIKRQTALSQEIGERLGFDVEKGRLDVSVHPFAGLVGPEDVRITTRYSERLPFEGMMGIVHEAGHGMYEQGRSKKHAGMPVSKPLSMGMHESQSLFWERMIGQGGPFWEAVLDTVYEWLPHTQGVDAGEFYFAINQINRSFIRVDADELTYPFHVMLRFDLEKLLLNGSLAVEDLPGAWNEGMKHYLGVEVGDDSNGCLQDIHWSNGMFGYFPTYTLGAMTAVQLFRYLKKEVMPDVEQRIREGRFTEIRDWLRKEVHEVGSLYPGLDELLEKVTGEKLNSQYFLEYLEEKYSRFY